MVVWFDSIKNSKNIVVTIFIFYPVIKQINSEVLISYFQFVLLNPLLK